MQADRHHLRRPAATLLVKAVEAVLQIGKELITAVKTLRGCEAHIVGIEGVGNDEMLAAARIVDPVRQIIGIAVGRIEEPPFLHDEPYRVHGATAGIPPEGALTGDFGVNAYRLPDMGALVFLAEVLVFDPFETVARNLPAGLLHRLSLIWRPQEGGCNGIDGERHIAGGEKPPKAPEASARAVFINRFHIPVPPAGPGLGADNLGEEGFRSVIAMEDAVLPALLVIENELNSDMSALRPLRIRNGAAITLEVTWLGLAHGPGLSWSLRPAT